MSLTHADLAGLVAALYGEPGSPSVNWDYMSPAGAPCFMGIVTVRTADANIIVPVTRGSFTFWDWMHDIQARATMPHVHPELGPVHVGFWEGVEEAWGVVKARQGINDLLLPTGHSLGGPHARFLAAQAKLDGQKPLGTVTWGNPREGYQQFAKFMEDVPGTSYQNTNGSRVDIVTRLPLWLPLHPYVHGLPRTKVNSPPPINSVAKELGEDAELHHFTLYRPATPPTAVMSPLRQAA